MDLADHDALVVDGDENEFLGKKVEVLRPLLDLVEAVLQTGLL